MPVHGRDGKDHTIVRLGGAAHKTNPTLDEILAAEAAMPELAALETEAAENVEKIYIRMGDDELL